MNEFILYEQLCELEDIANQYPDGKEHGKRFREAANRIVTRLYRVGVIGEFKRGKSSLVNAIIGAEVLPTDILPMTAAVTRVTYGTERKILIRFKNGSTEERSLEELIDFATKYDPEKERMAATIREIEVTYPSVFCKNHIDILDTPGMNDNEAMTNATLGILGEVDAALMVISANAPLSITEQNLILSLIERKGIRHIVFAVTHIDAVSSRASRQDEMIRFIRKRISEDVLLAAEARWAEDSYYLEKSRRILSDPDVYGVSSVQAMEGFIHDDEELLNQSRFPHFKNELLTLLTAAQSEDIYEEAVEAAIFVRDHLDIWYKTEMDKASSEMHRQIQSGNDRDAWFKKTEANIKLNRYSLKTMFDDAGMDANSLITNLTENLRSAFIRQLGMLTTDTYTDENIRRMILNGAKDAVSVMDGVGRSFYQTIRAKAIPHEKGLLNVSEYLGSSAISIREGIMRWRESPFCEFYWSESPVPSGVSLRGVNVMTHIQNVIHDSLTAYAEDIRCYTDAWVDMIFQQYDVVLSVGKEFTRPSSELYSAITRENALEVNYGNNKTELSNILKILEV